MNATPEAKTFFGILSQETEKEMNKKLEVLPEKISQKVYGFKIDGNLNPRKIRTKGWLVVKSRFLEDIKAELKVEPLAILHSGSWNVFCKKMGLFRLNVNKRGGVNADVCNFRETQRKATAKSVLEYLFAGFILGAMFCMLTYAIVFDVYQKNENHWPLIHYSYCNFNSTIFLFVVI